MIEDCFTEIQLIYNVLYKFSQPRNVTISFKISSPSIILMKLFNNHTSVSLRLLQIESIIKIQITSGPSNDSLWLDSRKHLNKKLGNTYSINSIKDLQVIERVFDRRIFKYFNENQGKTIEVILGTPLIVAKIMKYLKFREGEEIMLLSKDISGNLRSNSMYKAIYEARFGKTGFGLNLEWRKNYVRKIKERQSIY